MYQILPKPSRALPLRALSSRKLMGFIVPNSIFAGIGLLAYGTLFSSSLSGVSMAGLPIGQMADALRAAIPVQLPSMSVLETLSWSQAAHFAFWWYNNVEN